MGIGPISSGMVRPYVMNVNKVSAKSLERVSGVSGDMKSGKVDFSNLVEDNLRVNENPLAIGQTKDFNGLVEMQMAMGLGKAAMLFE